MNLSVWGIRNPLAAVLVFVVLTGLGLYGFRLLPIATLPDIALPTIQVQVMLPGATPSQLETEVTRKVENAVASLSDIDKIVSAVSEGQSVTRIEFEIGRDLDLALEEVRDAMDRIRVDLPNEIDEPTISRINLIGGTLLAYAVESDRLRPDELSWFVDDTVSKALFGVPGVGAVSRTGGVDREIRVALRPEALQAYGVPAGTVSSQLARLQIERPGGRTTRGGAEQSVRTISTVQSASDLNDYPIYLPDGRSVRLSALATVEDGAAEASSAAMLDGRSVISVSLQRTRGSSEVAVGAAVRKRIAQLTSEHPGLKFTEVASSVEEAKASYESSMTMLVEGALLAVLVVWLFLRDWRATWISALALPLSVLPTFGLMHFFDFSLNLLTLLALAVVVGILVDDAIVEVENVSRHRAMGKSAEVAAIDAANEIGTAVIATSATLAAVFVPVAFMPGVTGKFFREFGWTAAGAVLFSLLVARLLTPMLAARYMRAEPRGVSDGPWMQRYLRAVDWAIEHRSKTLLMALGTFVASLALVPLIPKTFLPAQNPSRVTLQLELAPGARLQDSLEALEQTRQRLQTIPEVKAMFGSIGTSQGQGMGGGIEFTELRKASLVIQFAAERQRDNQQLEDEIRARVRDLPGLRASFRSGGPGGRLELVLAGRDATALEQASRDLAAQIRGIPGLGTVTTSASLRRPEILIRPDPARAADLGVSTVDIAEAARIATSGDLRQRLAKLNLAERQIPIRVQLAQSALSGTEMLSQLRVPGARGPVPLSSVASVTESSGPARIDRLNRERNVTVAAELNGAPLDAMMKRIGSLPAYKLPPAGVRLFRAGDSEAFVDLFVGFALALLTGVLCVYLVLLLLFNSVAQPFTILAAVPLCGGGAFGALLLTGYELSMPALIGLLLLTGIATKNSILIVDYAIIAERDLGLSRHDALIDACRKRVRPVIMTTLAMGAGMLPLSLGLGADGNFRAPLGIAVIGGLITSTLLSLVVVPAAYRSIGDRVDRWRARRGRTRLQQVPQPVPEHP